MDLSIVIVNYNVKYFLQQCLASVFAALEGIDAEVWVVDNNSVDGSVAMVREQFPQVHLIANDNNPGFSVANNQALRQAAGDYLLLLNPDTLVERDTFSQCLAFMRSHPDCGGLGVKMLNGEGKFLKESKRGFPSPKTSFYKISGLIHLFPHHRRIAAYYMGHLSDDEVNEIDILPGAFLMISRPAMEKVGLLDETFFMYGEDIDFSWRIKLAGYKNYYLPSARIIHYKGESTKKGSMNYVYTFYNAMSIFSKKYFRGGGARFYNLLIHLAIWARAGLSFMSRVLRRLWLPLLDFLLIYGGFVVIKNLWAASHFDIHYYPEVYTWLVLPFYALVLMFGSWLLGGYTKPVRPTRIVSGMVSGAVALLVFYSLVDESQRYSRLVLLMGVLWSLLAVMAVRLLLSAAKVNGFALRPHHRNCLLVGGREETQRVATLLGNVGITPNYQGCVALQSDAVGNGDYFVGHIGQLADLIHYYEIDEVIFCSQDMSTQEIISHMSTLQDTGVTYKIAPGEGDYIIGSEVINSMEDLYAIDLYTLADNLPRRNKRILDTTVAILALLLSPILFWLQRSKHSYFTHCIQVLAGRKSWVGYEGNEPELPQLRVGIFTPLNLLPGRSKAQLSLNAHRLNVRYAKNYRLATDLSIILRNLRNL